MFLEQCRLNTATYNSLLEYQQKVLFWYMSKAGQKNITAVFRNNSNIKTVYVS